MPAIDLLGGKAVRLRQGSYDDVTVFNDDPVAAAREWAEGGAEWLHIVDLDGARDGVPANLDAIAAIASAVEVPVELGGGLRTAADVERAFDAGATRVVLGTALVKDPAFARTAAQRHPGLVVGGVDARDGKVAVAGWREGTAVDAAELVTDLAAMGIGRVVYTDIGRDGMGTGVDAAAYARLAARTGVPVIASGGVATLDDIAALARVQGAGIEAVIVGRALYDHAFSLPEAMATARGRASGAGRPGDEA